LEGKLATLPALEQAKGALMATYGITADAAFALLQFHSQNRNVKVRAIAAELTTLMCDSSSGAEAIIRFDRLLDEVTRPLPPSPGLTAPAHRAVVRAEGGAAALPQVDTGELDRVTLLAVAAAPPGITIAGNAPDLPLMYANDAFTEITGYPVPEILGRNCRFLQGAETDPSDIAKLSRAIHDGRDMSIVMRNYRCDGAPFWNEVSISPIRNRTNQITHYIGTQIVVTVRLHQENTGAA
jgi:PAS domain S-box-containing protein